MKMIMTQEEKKQWVRKNAAWLVGEKIDGLAFRYNILVSVTLPDGSSKDGWIVGAVDDGPEPIYTVEAKDRSGDIECPESAIQSKSD